MTSLTYTANGKQCCQGEMIKTLVTGASGLLGSHIVDALLARGYEVRALVRQTSDTSHLRGTGADIACGNVQDYNSLRPAVEGAQIVFHAAARVMPGWGRWRDYRDSIVRGTENMLRASAEAGVSRFLYVSTSTVYSRVGRGDGAVNECVPCEVVFSRGTYYEYAKLKAEEIVLDYHRQGRIKVTVIRPAMVYGPRDRLLSDRIYRHTATPIVVWPGRANPRIAPVFAADVADCAILAATNDRAIGQVYNVAPSQEVLFREFVAAMIRAEGGRRFQVTIPYSLGYVWCALMEGWAKLWRAEGLPYLTRSGLRFLNEEQSLDGSRARAELGWEPRVSMDEGCRLYVRWRRSQQRRP